MSLRGKVAAVLNERELVVNLGSENGVAEGMKLKVMEPEREILDPDTGEFLGRFDREKVRVKVAEVNPKYSVGRTYETYVINLGSDSFASVFSGGRGREARRVRTLRPNNESNLLPMDETDSFVNIGDPVVLVEDGI